MSIKSQFAIVLVTLTIVTQACGLFGDNADASQKGLPADILFQDDFSDPSSGWERVNETEGVTDYVDGAYRIFVNTPSYDIWANPGLEFTDTIIEVDAKKVAGPDDNDFGIVCRYQDMDKFYFFIISSDGYYGIARMIDGEQELLGEKTMAYSEAINQGLATNKLRVECVGDRLVLYVNQTLLIEGKDTTYASGDVGLIAGTFDTAGTDIYFDNFVAREP